MRVIKEKSLKSKRLGHGLNLLLSLFLLLQITSCGESGSKDDSFSQSQDFQTGCKINEDNLDNFLTTNVEEDVDCLGKYLELFVKFVEPESPELVGKLSQKNLENFIKKKRPGLTSILKYTPLFFNLSHLIFGDKLGYLSKDHINPLVKAAIEINKELVIVYPILEQKPAEEIFKIHQKKSGILIKSATKIANSLEKLFKNAPSQEKPLSITDTIDIFKTDDNQVNLEKIKSLTFLKRLITGGEFNAVTQEELRQLVGLIPKLTKIGFDFFQFERLVFDNEYQRYKFFNEVISTLEDALYFKDQPNAVLFNTADLENALINFKSEIGLEDIESYFGIIPEIKAVFGHNPEVKFLRADINKLLVHVKKVITYGEAFVDIYFAKTEDENGVRSNQVLLESNSPIVEDLLISNVIYKNQFKDFVRIAKNYRFFRGSNPIPFYGDHYRRNLNGMIEVAVIEYLYGEFAKYYEEKFPCRDEMYIRLRPFADPKKCEKNSDGQCIQDLRCKRGEDYGKSLSQGQIEFIVVKLTNALQKLDLTTPNMEYSTAETAMLMNDLFQFQSNSNELIDKYEIAEFGGQIISALSMKDNIISAVTKLCPDHISDLDNGYTVYGANCFRENFLEILFTKFEKKRERPSDLPQLFQYSTYLPSLINYLDNDTAPKVTFVMKMEQFTNTCYGYFKKPESEIALPMDEFLYESDMFGVFGGLFNIESTLTRFDTDPVNNYLEGPEIEVAFQHFKTAVQGLLADAITGKWQKIVTDVIDAIGPEDIAKKIFYYMLKYREVPNTSSSDKAIKLAKHMLNKKYREGVKVDRITMAAVLSGIKSSSKNKATPYQLSYICNKKPLPLPTP
jgi:hypothetical protein